MPRLESCRYAEGTLNRPDGVPLETMRYLIQLAIPALILVVTVLLLTRQRNARPRSSGDTDAGSGNETGSDKGMFFVILLIGAAVAVTAFFVIGNLGV